MNAQNTCELSTDVCRLTEAERTEMLNAFTDRQHQLLEGADHQWGFRTNPLRYDHYDCSGLPSYTAVLDKPYGLMPIGEYLVYLTQVLEHPVEGIYDGMSNTEFKAVCTVMMSDIMHFSDYCSRDDVPIDINSVVTDQFNPVFAASVEHMRQITTSVDDDPYILGANPELLVGDDAMVLVHRYLNAASRVFVPKRDTIPDYLK